MTRLVWTVARVRRMPVVLPFAVAVALAGLLAADGSLLLPLVPRSLPVPVLLSVVAGILVAAPLASSPVVEIGAVARRGSERAIALGLILSMTLLSIAPAIESGQGLISWNQPLTVVAVALASVVVIDRMAWLPTTVVTVGGTYLDLNSLGTLSQTLRDAGPVPLLAVAVLAAVYVVHGPVDLPRLRRTLARRRRANDHRLYDSDAAPASRSAL